MADSLQNIWNKLTSSYTADQYLIGELWQEIETSYTSRGRLYHNLDHLQYMMDKAVACRDKLNDFDTLLFSIFYHDLVYNIKRQDNERKSADIAKARLAELGVPAEKITRCQSQIMATKDHEWHADEDTRMLVDIDLAILGESPEAYKDYARKVRGEYAVYPDFIYNPGRKKVLRHLLAMDNIFKTAEFRNNYERQARENLRAELEEL